MKHIAITSSESIKKAVSTTVDSLKAGAVIAAPTETVYGLMTLWDNQKGRDRIFTLKDRPAEKYLQMLAPDLETAIRYGLKSDPCLIKLANCFWPGPLTIVCNAEDGTTIGLRIPHHPFVLAVLRQLEAPLAATSANRSGLPPAQVAENAVARLCGQPDLLVDGGHTVGEASTVISLIGPTMKILRPGPIPEKVLKAALEH